MEIDFNQLNSRIVFFRDAIEAIKTNKIFLTGIVNQFDPNDRYQILNEIHSFIKDFPEKKETYLTPLLRRYELLLDLIADYFPDHVADFREHEFSFLIKYDGTERIDFLDKITRAITFIVEELESILRPEIQEQQETPLKYEKLKPIEKILIMDYLKIDHLSPYQMGLKPGNYFLSRLLDINPESIKNPLSKLPDYTTNNKLTESQARNLYPILEKVKQFFDESELFKISKLIEERIKQLRFISGKD